MTPYRRLGKSSAYKNISLYDVGRKGLIFIEFFVCFRMQFGIRLAYVSAYLSAHVHTAITAMKISEKIVKFLFRMRRVSVQLLRALLLMLKCKNQPFTSWCFFSAFPLKKFICYISPFLACSRIFSIRTFTDDFISAESTIGT